MFFKTSHIQKMARILREMKRPAAEEGTDELVDQYKKDTPGQGKEVEEHCGVCGQGIKEVELDEKGTAYPATVDTLRKIVKDKQHQTVMFKSGQALVDLFTASAIIAVYDGMKKPELKKKLEDMIKTKEGFLKTQAFAMKMVK